MPTSKTPAKREKRPPTVRFRTESPKLQALMRGEITVQDMDDDELVRMQFKDKNGKFTGRPPKVVPRELAVAAQKELLKRGQEKFETNFLGAIDVLSHLMRSAEEDAVKLKAATYLIERVAGKTPDKVEVSGDAPWQLLISRIVAGDPEPVVVPGEVVKRDGS